ncbi:MAG: hypothetical protein B9S32_05930 [Verrucomicrobia bacterium Tous-C9LFEB]|nr:MAG: hypothetical protein B9S32_05930 [Verrucomicrobia bacterium Tous-C9LFEB]
MAGENVETGRRELADKEVLFVEGQPWDGLYKVDSGAIEIYRERDGKVILLGVETVGSLIGTATLLSRQPRLASARARGPSVVSYLPLAPTESLLNSMPPWGKAIIKDLLYDLNATDEHLIEASLRADSVPDSGPLPVVAVQKFLEGLCWSQGYRPATYGGKAVEVLPLGDLGTWLGPVLRMPAEKVRGALCALQAARLVRVEEIENLGPCLLRVKS